MRLMLLTARPELRANARLVEAAAKLEVELSVVDATAVSALVGDDGLRPVGVGEFEPLPDAVLARVGNWRPESVLAVLEAILARGVATTNPPRAIRLGRDHWMTVTTLAAAGLPVPPTIAGADPEALAVAAVDHFEFPVVVKQRRSRMGVGVIRCATRDHLEAVLDSLWRVGDEIVVQRWLPGGGCTYRLLVAGRHVVASARFRATGDEWRSNAARGGAAEPFEPTADEIKLAVAAAEALGLGQCGIDMVREDEGPRILEVNPTPGFLRLEEATGIDVARALIENAVAA